MDILHAIGYNNINLINFLIENGLDVNIKYASGLTPIIWAWYKNNYEVVKLLIEKGAYVESSCIFLYFKQKNEIIDILTFEQICKFRNKDSYINEKLEEIIKPVRDQFNNRGIEYLMDTVIQFL